MYNEHVVTFVRSVTLYLKSKFPSTSTELFCGDISDTIGAVVSIVNVVFVGACALLLAESATVLNDTVAVPSTYVLIF